MSMNVLIVGSGGREHALAWKVAQSDLVGQVFVAPGNAGTAQESKVTNIAIGVDDIDSLVDFAKTTPIDLTIVGPEKPLVLGLVDAFEKNGLPIFGPNQACAQLEGSKAFSKDFLTRHKIPTASYATFTDAESALNYLKNQNYPCVIKADGLAAGKGVIIAESFDEGFQAINDMFSSQRFGQAGSKVVIESFISGEELSYIIMVDGSDFLPMASSQDHKARDNGDKGPNTGGMGAYSPAPLLTSELEERILETVIHPTIQGLKADGLHYRGFLYVGLMIDQQGNPQVLEFNCRFGDPETQPIMLRLNSDLAYLCLSATNGLLNQQQVDWLPEAALGVVLAAGGYPNDYNKGDIIRGLESVSKDEAKVFHAGTATKSKEFVTDGGRVLCVTALGENIKAAQEKAYSAVDKISWPNVYYRDDIGHKAL